MNKKINTIKKGISTQIKGLKRQFSEGSLPDFIIIGAQKAGTTALYDYLLQHPSILGASDKEIHFFDRPSSRAKGINWYKKQFPSLDYKKTLEDKFGNKIVTGEATGAYLFHPLVPQLVYQSLTDKKPKLKLIVLLREPISRALSHYHHNLRFPHREDKSFHEAILLEDARISGEIEKVFMDYNYHPTNLLRYSYTRRGFYMEQIERWMQYFHQENMFFISSSELLTNPDKITNSVFEFLGLPQYEGLTTEPKHVGDYQKSISSETSKFLENKLEPENQKLFNFLGNKIW